MVCSNTLSLIGHHVCLLVYGLLVAFNCNVMVTYVQVVFFYYLSLYKKCWCTGSKNGRIFTNPVGLHTKHNKMVLEMYTFVNTLQILWDFILNTRQLLWKLSHLWVLCKSIANLHKSCRSTSHLLNTLKSNDTDDATVIIFLFTIILYSCWILQGFIKSQKDQAKWDDTTWQGEKFGVTIDVSVPY